ncbi:unnamed protein product [Caretta caretta]
MSDHHSSPISPQGHKSIRKETNITAVLRSCKLMHLHLRPGCASLNSLLGDSTDTKAPAERLQFEIV